MTQPPSKPWLPAPPASDVVVPESLRATLTRGVLLRWAATTLAAVLLLGLACSLVGPYATPSDGTWRIWDWSIWGSQVWTVRIFRLSAAAVVGAALGSAGLATQGLLRNPLAEPYLLGISSGAGVGVLLGMWAAQWTPLPEWCTTPLLSLGGALATALAVYGLSQQRGRMDPLILLLSGAIVNICNGAVILVLLQLLQGHQVIQFIGWGLGQIPESLWFRPWLLILSGTLTLGCWIAVFTRAFGFNALGLGDEVAASAGVPVHRLRIEMFLVISLLTAASVSLAGPIGFVGLMVPHVCRLLVGPDHRILSITCATGGALFLMLADTFCRIAGKWIEVGELPVGIVTALSGGPFFLFLLRRKLRGRSS